MTLEIIIIAIFASAAMLAAVLAVHNIRELRDTRIRRDEAEERSFTLELENEGLVRRIDELKLELKTERINSKMLERALLDSVTESAKNEAETSAAEESEKLPAESESASEHPFERLPKQAATNFYPAEYMTEITNTRSEQYKLQQKCHTETGTGLRYYYDGAEEYYTAAMGGAYGDTIGDAWRVTLECGSVFNVMRGDFKHALPAEADDFGDVCRNYDKQRCMCVLEFITDKDAMPQYLKEAGGFHGLDFFGGLYGTGGNIVKMEYLGRRWES